MSTICLTKGKNGVKLSNVNSGILFQEAFKIDHIEDVTGAGDAFWSGFLFAILNKLDFYECITIAQKLASIKLQNIGTLPENIDILKEIIEV